MKDTRYAYAVANVRANENSLISQSVFEQLVSADTADVALGILADKGFVNSGETYNGVSAVTENKMNEVWDYLCEITPDKTALEFLIVSNDYHNLKTSLKAIVSQADAKSGFISPCLIPPDTVFGAVSSRKFGELPEWLERAASDGYDILTSTSDGQLLDIMLDRVSLETMCEMAKDDDFTNRLTQEMTALYDFKIALRMAATHSSETVCRDALCKSDIIDIKALSAAALKGTEQVKSVMSESGYSDLAAEVSSADFEKAADNRISSFLNRTETVSFGIEPLVAYYFKKRTEIRNIRLIVNAKHAGLSNAAIRERMRDIYV